MSWKKKMGQMQNKNRSQRPLFRSLRKLKALKLRKKKINTMEKIPVKVDIWLIELFVFNKNIGQEKGSYWPSARFRDP